MATQSVWKLGSGIDTRAVDLFLRQPQGPTQLCAFETSSYKTCNRQVNACKFSFHEVCGSEIKRPNSVESFINPEKLGASATQVRPPHVGSCEVGATYVGGVEIGLYENGARPPTEMHVRAIKVS